MTRIIILSLALFGCGAQDKSATGKFTNDVPTSTTSEPATSSQGPSGPQGEKGPKGDKGDKGDAGTAGAAGKDGIGTAGVAGDAGANGQDGSQGVKGDTGSRGAAGAIGLYTAANVQIGYFYGLDVAAGNDSAQVVTANGGYFQVAMGDGAWLNSASFVAQVNGLNTGATCYSAALAGDCSGQCVMGADSSNGADEKAMVGSVVYDNHGKLWRYTGAEADGGNNTTLYYSAVNYQGTPGCHYFASGVTLKHAWPLTVQETLPGGITIPLGQLHIGIAQ